MATIRYIYLYVKSNFFFELKGLFSVSLGVERLEVRSCFGIARRTKPDISVWHATEQSEISAAVRTH
jgi:hypothetical protein